MLLIRWPFQALYRSVGVLSGYSSGGRNGLLPIWQPFQALHQIRGVLSGYSSGGHNGLLPIRQPFQALRQIRGVLSGHSYGCHNGLLPTYGLLRHHNIIVGFFSGFFPEDCYRIVTHFENTSYGFALIRASAHYFCRVHVDSMASTSWEVILGFASAYLQLLFDI